LRGASVIIEARMFERLDYTSERQRHEKFVGRARLLARLDQLLVAGETDRWVVITGGPGMGKRARLAGPTSSGSVNRWYSRPRGTVMALGGRDGHARICAKVPASLRAHPASGMPVAWGSMSWTLPRATILRPHVDVHDLKLRGGSCGAGDSSHRAPLAFFEP
jgi:hypothetical protein